MANKFLLIILCFIGIKAGAQTSALSISDSLAAIGKQSEAIDLLKNTEPKTDKIYLKLAKLYQATGKDPRAKENYKMVLKLNPERLLTAIEYGDFLIETNDIIKADSLFGKLIDKYPDNANFQYRMGLIKEKQDDKMAEHFYYRAISLDSTHQGAIYKVAKKHLQRNKFSNAIELSKIGLDANSNNVSLLSILAQSYSASRQFEKAIPVYEKLVELGQGSEFIYDKLGFAYYRMENLPKAAENFKNSLELEDRNSGTHYNLGKIYNQMGELQKAEQHLLMSLLIKKQPVDAEFLSLGLNSKDQRKYKEAFNYFEKALQENPKNERALLEKAIAADAYFQDKSSVLNLYQQYLDKFGEIGNEQMKEMAKFRKRELQKEIHMAE